MPRLRSYALLSIAFLSFFQSPASLAQSTPRFRTQSELVLVPATIRKSGKHLGSLTKNELVVLQDGKPQNLAFVEEVKVAGPRIPAAKRPSGMYANFLPEDPKPRRFTIIALDTINTDAFAQGNAKKAILNFLDEGTTAGDPTALIAINYDGIRVVHDFTTDPQLLKEAVRQLKEGHKPSDKATLANLEDSTKGQTGPDGAPLRNDVKDLTVGMSKAFDTWRDLQPQMAIMNSMRGLRQIAWAFGGVPGRKSLIWCSGGFRYFSTFSAPVNADGSEDPQQGRMMPTPGHLQYEFLRTMRDLNTANIVLYPVQVLGDQTHWSYSSVDTTKSGTTMNMGTWGSGNVIDTRGPQYQQENLVSTLLAMANATGGRATYGTANLEGAFRDAANDSAEYYLLGYYLDRSQTRPGWHNLKVQVKGGGEVRARPGFRLEDNSADPTRKKSEMETAISSPMDFTGIPIIMRWGATEAASSSSKKRMVFEILTPGGHISLDEEKSEVNIEFLVLARVPGGKTAGLRAKTVKGQLKPEQVPAFRQRGWLYKDALELDPGSYDVRFIVRDNATGHIGSLSVPLKVN